MVDSDAHPFDPGRHEGPDARPFEVASHWDRRDWLVLAALLLAHAVSRLAWLALAPETTAYWEENYRWSAAHDLLNDPVFPLFDHQADHYQGGSLVVIGMTVPFFLLLGESVLTLKLAAVVFALATLAALYVLGRSFFDRRVGVLVGLAYVAGPPLVAYSSLVVMGSHGESTLFSVVQLILFLGLLSGRWRTPAGFAALGFAGGLGLWFCYTSGLSLAACGLTWLLIERRPPRAKELLAALGGLACGLLPWLVYNAGRDFVGLTRVLEMFGHGDPIDGWVPQSSGEKLLLLLSRDIPIGILFPFQDPIARAARSAIVLAYFGPMVAGTLLALARQSRRLARRIGLATIDAGDASTRRELVFFVYALTFGAVFLVSDFSIDPDVDAHAYRLFLPPAVLLGFPAAVTAARALAAGGRARRIAAAGCALVLVASAAGTLLIATRKPGRDQALQRRGGDMVHGLLLHRKWERDLDRALNAARQIPDEKRRGEVMMGIGWGLEYRYEQTGVIRSFFPQLRELEIAERSQIVIGMRWALSRRIGQVQQVIQRGDGTLYHASLLQRLVVLEQFITEPRTWFLMTGLHEKAREPARDPAPEDRE